jgi:hypothetical protein
MSNGIQAEPVDANFNLRGIAATPNALAPRTSPNGLSGLNGLNALNALAAALPEEPQPPTPIYCGCSAQPSYGVAHCQKHIPRSPATWPRSPATRPRSPSSASIRSPAYFTPPTERERGQPPDHSEYIFVHCSVLNSSQSSSGLNSHSENWTD